MWLVYPIPATLLMTVTKEFNYKDEQRGFLFCFFLKDSFLTGVLDLCTSVIIEMKILLLLKLLCYIEHDRYSIFKLIPRFGDFKTLIFYFF